MVSRNNELDALRALARKRHRDVSAKISRNERVKDVRIGGSKYDPRRDIAKLERYNAKQTKAYLQQLDQFMNRKTQFVPDAHRRPMPQSDWNAYKRLERQRAKQINAEFQKVKDVFLPSSNMTVEERMEMRTPKHKQAGNPAVNAPFRPVDRKSTSIQGEKELKRLTKSKEKEVVPGQDDKRYQKDMEAFGKLAKDINMPALGAVKNLTPRQFKILWNFTPFADQLSHFYLIAQDLLSDKQRAYDNQAMNDAQHDIERLIDDAKKY
jgi:hypothetical protein